MAYYERYLKLAGLEDGNRNKAESELEAERAKLLPLAGEPTLAASLAPAACQCRCGGERRAQPSRSVDKGPFYKRWWFFAAVGAGSRH